MANQTTPATRLSPHDVLNQAGDPPDFDAFAANAPLREAVRTFGAGWSEDALHGVGQRVGSRHLRDLAQTAERQEPVLRTHDRFGRRLDVVDYHPAYHDLMAMVFASGVHSLPWTEERAGAHVARAALSYLWNQGENGVCCPVAMTFSGMSSLRQNRDLEAYWGPRLARRAYDPTAAPAEEKDGITLGMAMTEKQAGSDLRRTRTTARPAGSRKGAGAEYLLSGHKWFFSVPMSDLFLTLARTQNGISCFLARGWLETGARNGLRVQRLKDKCGNRANASSEVEFHDLRATLLGEEGRGLATVLDAAHLARLECAIGSAGLMRNALIHAKHHVNHRSAFGKRLIDQPLMRNVLADLALEAEAAVWLVLRLAAALDRQQANETERLLFRVGVPLAKYWVSKRTPAFAAEAMEIQGGNGYVEEGPLARLFRESPLNGIWEGASNVICLDVLRALDKRQGCADAVLADAAMAKGIFASFDAAHAGLEKDLGTRDRSAFTARRIVARMALVLQASLLIRHAPEPVASLFCASRMDGDGLGAFGSLGSPDGTDAVIDRIGVC